MNHPAIGVPPFISHGNPDTFLSPDYFKHPSATTVDVGDFSTHLRDHGAVIAFLGPTCKIRVPHNGWCISKGNPTKIHDLGVFQESTTWNELL